MRTPDDLRQAGADLDPPVYAFLPVLRKGPDGVDLQNVELRYIELVFAWPLVYTESCLERFKGRVGTHEEVEGAPSPHTLFVLSFVADAWFDSPLLFSLSLSRADIILYHELPPPAAETFPAAVAHVKALGWQFDPVESW